MPGKVYKYLYLIVLSLFLPFCFSPAVSLANGVTITNVALAQPDSTAKTVKITFDVSWNNSWRNNTNYDALWVLGKYSKDSGATWLPVTLKASGTNPSGFTQSSGTALEIIVPSEKKGAFLYRTVNGAGTVNSTGVTFVWDWNIDNLSETDSVLVRVFCIEMVYIPSASFYAGDNSGSAASFKQGSADAEPWMIASESQIDVSQATNNGFYYVSAGNAGEASTGSSFSVQGDFPKGSRAFYCMKYEISEGQWVDFFNTLSVAAKIARDITSNTGKNSDEVVSRNTISWVSGNATTSRPERACGYLSWMDLCAYADWAGLRPMSELEYEKACRGPQAATPEERAWGLTSQIAPGPNGINGAEDGTEIVITPGANCNYSSVNYTSGDGGTGPLRCGIFATSVSNRNLAGSGYYGVMELSGNLWERIVTLGNQQGRDFSGTHGDGVLTVAAGHEGAATNADWPGMDTVVVNGITTATGSGFRGGSYDTDAAFLRTSDRSRSSLTSNIRSPDYGGRLVRTAP